MIGTALTRRRVSQISPEHTTFDRRVRARGLVFSVILAGVWSWELFEPRGSVDIRTTPTERKIENKIDTNQTHQSPEIDIW